MQSNFWQQLKRPIIGLSPMDGVTDHPFRFIQKKYGQPAVVLTEFTSVEGLCHGAERLLTEFLYDESQRPIVGQIYGTTPDFFRQAAILLCQLGFDGIDINMGCPAKNVAHSGAGAALIQTPSLAQNIIRATQQGINDWLNGQTVANCPDLTPDIQSVVLKRSRHLPTSHRSHAPRPIPVSVKTRIGYHQPVIDTWIPQLLEMNLAAISLHGRTLKQHYSGHANWELIGRAAELTHQTDTLLLGNGDIGSLADAHHKITTYQTDGALIGRATFGNPFIFHDQPPSNPSRFQIALEHARLYEQTFAHQDRYHFMPMRKHLGWYVRDIPDAAHIRTQLFQTNTAIEVESVLREHNLLAD